MIHDFETILNTVNTPSEDNGAEFTVRDRITGITALLSGSRYHALKTDGLSLVYAHDGFDPTGHIALISCHIDAVYTAYFVEDLGDELLGTFDNSICNAVAIDLMLHDAQPSNMLVAFTGDEEVDLHGADDTYRFIVDRLSAGDRLEMVITMDITSEAYGTADFTIENYFAGGRQIADARLEFGDDAAIARYLSSRLPGHAVVFVDDAAGDESWQYDEYGLNCISYCIPTCPHPQSNIADPGHWMHDDRGILVRRRAIEGYRHALAQLCQAIGSDIR